MICHASVDFKESCLNPNCLAQKAKAQYKDVKEPMITEFDYIKDLKDILERNHDQILQYRQQLANNSVSDLCNGKYYKSRNLEPNSIGLCFFADAAAFRGFQDGSIQGLFAYIPVMPPAIRAAFHNILKILLITGKKFTFNDIFTTGPHNPHNRSKSAINRKFRLFFFNLS